MLKIKLSRTGKRNEPHYRIVVAEARSKNQGRVVAALGHYNPRTNPSTLVIDKIQYQKWLAVGAQPTASVHKLISKATS
ncbi:30S ribosomal protein S16 [Microgenomates group bacterium RIFCSPLOWO2_01_FULL_46_13]|nr:MAG: 30S ribosomal protein S16 [Microgenomates group bacterium RIFCSPHIGHO2_01_FULL_45_11]OGV94784.1 MAG: 30S ribosomal protein S16 [Microgenomates group bacterium RIFCSPLOWO2_01_FULL_46_13]